MEKTTLLTLSAFLFILVTISLISAADYNLNTIQGLPSNVVVGETYSIQVNFNNSNNQTQEVELRFRGNYFDLPSNDNINYNESKNYNINLNIPISAQDSFSTTLFVDIYNNSILMQTKSLTFSADVIENSFCQDKGLIDAGDLEIAVFEILNQGRGEDDEWQILDEIEIEVIIENTNRDDRIRDVITEIKILNSNGEDVTYLFDLDDEQIDLGSIRQDSEETATFKIPEVAVDIEEGNYFIYVIAYSEDDTTQCISTSRDLRSYGSSEYYAEFSVEREYDRGIIIKDFQNNMVASCGSEVELNLELWNIGEDREDNVLIHAFNQELGIDEKIVLENFRDGRKRDLTLRFNIPSFLDKSSYTIEVVTYFDYDKDFDEQSLNAYFENSRDDLDERYLLRLDTVGCEIPEPIVSARLLSEKAVVEEELQIALTVVNPSSVDVTYTVSLNDYQEWSELLSVQPTSINLGPGQSGEVIIKLRPLQTGVNGFNVAFTYADERVFVQDISVNIEDKETTVPGFGDLFEDENLIYWILGALIFLIILLFIIIIVVIAKRS